VERKSCFTISYKGATLAVDGEEQLFRLLCVLPSRLEWVAKFHVAALQWWIGGSSVIIVIEMISDVLWILCYFHQNSFYIRLLRTSVVI
jgi:hypothetical protein